MTATFDSKPLSLIKHLVDDLFKLYVNSVREKGVVTNNTPIGHEISLLVFLAELFCEKMGSHPDKILNDIHERALNIQITYQDQT